MKESFIVFFTLLLLGCATVKPLDGGEKDTTPPKILSYTPDSASLNYSGNIVSLEFDEYVKGVSLTQNVIISPTPITTPEIAVQGKKLSIKFNESLNENTTYTILLNGAIKDVNEGNVLPTSKHVFSTGPVIDSLQVSYIVLNSFTNKVCEECLVAIYPVGSDSTPITTKPSYLNKTNANGYVTISNLPDNQMFALALKDNNSNLLLDFEDEVSLSKPLNFDEKDTLQVFPYLDQSIRKPTLLKRKKAYLLQFVSTLPFNKMSTTLTLNDKAANFELNSLKDTLSSYLPIHTDSISIKLSIDTFSYSYKRYISKKDTTYKVRVLKTHRTKTGFSVKTNSLISLGDSSLFKVFSDTIEFKEADITTNKEYMYFNNPAFLDKPLTLYIKPGLIKDIYGNTNRNDTLKISGSKDHLPDLKLSITASSSGIIQLLNKKGDLVSSKHIESDTSISFNNLNPGVYSVKTIIDSDKNGLWTTGNYLLKIEPEEVIMSEEFELRLDWDKELDLQF